MAADFVFPTPHVDLFNIDRPERGGEYLAPSPPSTPVQNIYIYTKLSAGEGREPPPPPCLIQSLP